MMDSTSGARLAQLFLETPIEEGLALPSRAEFTGRVEQWQKQRGIERPLVPLDDTEPDPRHLLYWLLRMAIATYERCLTPLPPPEPALLARFVDLISTRPIEIEDHAQLHIDAESSLRRAAVIRDQVALNPGPVLAVGDDDEVTLALALLGVPALHAVDIDERLLAHLADQSQALGHPVQVGCVDVFEDRVPTPWRGAFSAVITDPIRSHEPCMGFLEYALGCLSNERSAGLFWADHPDWNFEYDEVLASLRALGMSPPVLYPLWHAYPITSTWLPDLDQKCQLLGVDPLWFRNLTREVKGWSHLHQLQRLGTALG